MKARKFFAFVAGAAMLFGVGCTPDSGAEGDAEEAKISVAPAQAAVTLEGGTAEFTITSNSDWTVTADADVTITPATGSNDGVVTVTIPASAEARNIVVKFDAVKSVIVAGSTIIDDASAVATIFQNENGDTSYATNVKKVRTLLTKMSLSNTTTAVTEEIAAMTLTGIVVGYPDGNMSKNTILAIQDNTTETGAGLMLLVDNAKSFTKGQVVSVSLTGATAGLYGKAIQLTATAEATALGAPVVVTPIVVEYDEIFDYESQYIKVVGVHPEESAVDKTFGDSSFNKNVPFLTSAFDEIIIRMSSYASFKDETIVGKSGYICGVASRYNNDVQMLPQVASDIVLTEDYDYENELKTCTIADIKTAGKYRVENAWVVGFTGNGVILTDSSNAFINVYISGNTNKTIGAKMNVEGVAKGRDGGFQFDSPNVEKLEGTVEVTYPTPADYTAGDAVKALAAKFVNAETPYHAEYAEFKGIVNVSGGYYNFFFANVDSDAITGSLTKTPDASLNLDDYNGVAVTLRGFVTDFGEPYLSIVPTSLEVDTTITALSAANIENVVAAGVEDAATDLSASNLTDEDITVTYDETVVTAARTDVANGKLYYTVSANEGGAREGWIKLNAEGVEEVTVTVSQLSATANVSTIAEVWAGSASEYIVAGAQAVAICNKQVVIADETGCIALYKPTVTPEIGDIVTVNGSVSTYYGLFQFNSAEVTVTGHNDTISHPAITSMSGADLDAWIGTMSSKGAPKYVEIKGLVTISGNNYNVTIPGAESAVGSLKASDLVTEDTIKSFDGKTVSVKGYLYAVYSNKYCTMSALSIEEDTTVKILAAADIDDVSAEGVTNATAEISSYNVSNIAVKFDGTVVTAASVAGNVLTYTVAANTGAAREGWIKLSAEGADEVTIKVAQQEALSEGCVSATIDFSQMGYANAQDFNGQTITVNENITLALSKGEGSNTPKYYNTGTALRLYAKNTMTVTATKNIVSIELVFDEGEKEANLTADGYSAGKWAGSSQSILFTQGGDNGHCRIQKMIFVYEE